MDNLNKQLKDRSQERKRFKKHVVNFCDVHPHRRRTLQVLQLLPTRREFVN